MRASESGSYAGWSARCLLVSGAAGLTEDRRREEKRVLDGEDFMVNEDSCARGTDTDTKQTGQTNERQGRSEAEARREPRRECGG